MDVEESLKVLDGGEFRIYETPVGTKLSIKSPWGEDYEWTPEEREAMQAVTAYQDDVVAIYEAVEEYEGDRMRWDVGRVLSESDCDRLGEVVDRVEEIELSLEDCREAFEENDEPPES